MLTTRQAELSRDSVLSAHFSGHQPGHRHVAPRSVLFGLLLPCGDNALRISGPSILPSAAMESRTSSGKAPSVQFSCLKLDGRCSATSPERWLIQATCAQKMAGDQGFEPWLSGSEPRMLPLHQSPKWERNSIRIPQEIITPGGNRTRVSPVSGSSAWVRTKASDFKGRCATVTPRNQIKQPT